jgi:Tol biopolymer transport system component
VEAAVIPLGDWKRSGLWLGLAAAVLASGPFAGSASATFPGKNGRIVFEVLTESGGQEDCLTPSCSERRLAAVDSRTGRRLAFDPCRDPIECNDETPTVSPDGRRIAFTRGQYTEPPTGRDFPDRFSLAVTGLRGQRVRLLDDRAFEPAWSPTGRWIAFGGPEGIQLIGSDGRGRRRVLPGRAGEVDWSSRGTLAFVRQRGRQTDIYTARPNGKRVSRVTTGGNSTEPSWSPDGRSLVYTRVVRGRAFRVDVVVRGSDGRTTQVVRRAVSPVWSPDRTQIAFIRGGDIWLVRLQDGRERKLYRVETGSAASLSWRPLVADQ